MRWVVLTFLGLLLWAHTLGDFAKLLAQPLSLFRTEPTTLFGYAIFSSLMVISVLYYRALCRLYRNGEALIVFLTVILLFIVATTDSFGGFHLLASLALLLALYVYYAVLLFRAQSFWVFGHLFVPIMLGLGTQAHSYGLWQKSLIVYFVLATAIHYEWLMRLLPRPRSTRKRKGTYRLEVMTPPN
jgi:hypothetical protein